MHTGQLVQEPVVGRAEALLVLDGSTRHFDCCVRLVVEVVGSPVESKVLDSQKSPIFVTSAVC